ncbi:MAG: CpsD/CapB family tyrosine-protein kinase [Acidimicrobiales bacterium]
MMRTNLMLAVQDIEHPVVMFTSARAAEGKTSTVGNLAPIIALASHRVVVVDFDLRHPDLHNAFDLTNEKGLADVLRGDVALEDCMQYVEVTGANSDTDCGLYVLTAGEATNDPAELIGSGRTARLLEVLANQADIVLLDAPPVLGFADALVLGRAATGVVLVVEARITPAPVVVSAKDALIRNQARLLGVVINKMEVGDTSRLEDGYGYGYGYAAGYSDHLAPHTAQP